MLLAALECPVSSRNAAVLALFFPSRLHLRGSDLFIWGGQGPRADVKRRLIELLSGWRQTTQSAGWRKLRHNIRGNHRRDQTVCPLPSVFSLHPPRHHDHSNQATHPTRSSRISIPCRFFCIHSRLPFYSLVAQMDSFWQSDGAARRRFHLGSRSTPSFTAHVFDCQAALL